MEEIYGSEIERPRVLARSAVGFKALLLLTVVALIGGFLAGLVQDNLFESYYQGWGAVNLEPKAEGPKLLDLNFLLKDQDNQYDQVLSEIRSHLVGFYAVKKSQGILDSVFLEKDFLGTGVVVTSDGWLLTHHSVIGEGEFVVVTGNKEILEPVQQVEDAFSGAVLVKVAKDGLSPARFADVNSLSPANALLATRYSLQNHGSDIVKTSLSKFAYHDQAKPEDFLLTTEAIDHYLKTAGDFSLSYNGATLVNEANEVVGLMFDSGRSAIDLALPAYYLKSATNNFLVNSQEIIRSSLGVYYLDLSETIGLEAAVTEGRLKGAVILGNAAKDILAVAEGSAGETAGLAAGDIVIKVNGEEVDEKNSLTKLIQDYTPGQEISLTVVRQGEELELKAVLGEI